WERSSSIESSPSAETASPAAWPRPCPSATSKLKTSKSECRRRCRLTSKSWSIRWDANCGRRLTSSSTRRTKRSLRSSCRAVVLIWIATLQCKVIAAKSNLGTLETKWKSIEKDYQKAVEHRRKSLEVDQKLAALARLTTNRFLWGTALNAFQQTMNGIDDIQA